MALRMNILASYTGVIVPDSSLFLGNMVGWNFGDLLYQDADTTYWFHGKSLRELAIYADSALTFGARREAGGDTANYEKFANIFQQSNQAFRDTSHLLYDTISYLPTIRIKSTKALAENAPFLKRNFVIPDKSRFNFLSQVLPTKYSLLQNYPNPFNPTTTIGFELPEDASVSITLYNVLGQQVASLLKNAEYESGYNEIGFDASTLSSGVYFYRIKAKSLDDGASFSAVRKMVLMK